MLDGSEAPLICGRNNGRGFFVGPLVHRQPSSLPIALNPRTSGKRGKHLTLGRVRNIPAASLAVLGWVTQPNEIARKFKPNRKWLTLTSLTTFGGANDDVVSLAHRICPFASTTTCYDVSEGFDNAEFRMIATGCRRWTCPVCGPRKKSALIRRITVAHPNRFVTLTLDRSRTADETLQCFTKNIPKLIKALRSEFGTLEYLRMREQCVDGYPHFHFLMRSKFIPHERLKALWCELTKATIVDIRKAHGRSTGYVAKYISKARSSDGAWHRQRIAVSQGFWLDDRGASDFENFTHSREHPAAWVSENCSTSTPVRIRPLLYRFEDRIGGDEPPEELQAAGNGRGSGELSTASDPADIGPESWSSELP